ncbi:GNAT family N-acetyltransferase [Candidatus Woesearchaeota archaeon]|nr:GNAT family N-acetyltransferase [Candidatus Woesearchaeota archaeon]
MIIELDEDGEEWRWFLENNEHYIFHRPEYLNFIKETFPNIKPQYFGIREREHINTVFPFFHVNQPGLRKVLAKYFSIFQEKTVSCAFNDYGGPCGEENPIIHEILENIKNGKYRYIEIRQGIERFDQSFEKYQKKQYKRFVLKLGDKEAVWKGIQKSKRKAIKKSQMGGIVVKEVPENEINSLYKIYLKNMKEFGELPYPKKYFSNFYKFFIKNGLGKIFGAYYKNKLISILIGYCCSNRVHIIIAVSEKKFLHLRPNDAVHWGFIEWANDRGYAYFDFGHTREDSGQMEYKRKWGGELKDLRRYYISQHEIPDVDPTNPNYQKYIKLWQKLPIFISKLIGPWLREGLGI